MILKHPITDHTIVRNYLMLPCTIPFSNDPQYGHKYLYYWPQKTYTHSTLSPTITQKRAIYLVETVYYNCTKLVHAQKLLTICVKP